VVSAVPASSGGDAALVLTLVLVSLVLIALLIRGVRRANRVIDEMPLPPQESPLRVVDPPVTPGVRACLDLARTGDTAQLLELVRRDRLSPDVADPRGITPLMEAAANGHPDTVSALIELGADLDRACSRGLSPLCHALLRGDEATIRLLLRHGAHPDLGHPSPRDIAEQTGRTHFLAS
jgi:uncharacterized protein